MSIHFGTSGFVFERGTWQPEVLAKLESHHIAAWAGDSASRTRFGASLQRFLVAQSGTEVCVLHGRNILDLEGLCSQLERLFPVDQLARSVDGANGLASILRNRGVGHQRVPMRQRFFLWHDADVLIRHNPELFNQVAEVIAGVSAEMEFAGDGGLMIQRCIYMGGQRLADMARNPESNLNRWSDDGPGIPFWALVSGEEYPTTTLCSIDSLID